MTWVIFLQCVGALSTVPAPWALSSEHKTISICLTVHPRVELMDIFIVVGMEGVRALKLPSS